MTRLWRVVALTVFGACALATPLGGRALGRACAAGAVHVAVIVDSGSGSTVSAVCVPGGAGDNGATILAARASMLGVPQPRYSASGLLCAIDGVPETGCGEAHGGHYAYWSYWHGKAGKWSYNNFGPASWGVDADVVEGWRYQPNGSGLPTDPPPRGPATASAVCVPPPPASTSPRTTVATSPRSTAAIGPASTVGVQQVPSTPVTRVRGPATTASTTTRPAGSSNATTATTVRRAAAGASGAPSESTSSPTSVGLSARGLTASGPTHSSGGAPVGLIAGVALVIVLGGGGAIAARRRSRPAS